MKWLSFLPWILLIIISQPIYAQTTFTFQGTADNVFTNSANWLGNNAPPADVAGGFIDIESGNGASPFSITNVDLTYVNIVGFSLTNDGTDDDYTFTGAGSLSFQDNGFITNAKNGTTTISVAVIGAGANLTTNAINGALVFADSVTTPSGTITVAGANLTDFQGLISGSGGLTSNSAGDINLRSANTFTGNVNITGTSNFNIFTSTSFGAGDIAVSGLGSSVTNASGGPLTVANDISITGTTFTDESVGAATTTFSGVISGTGIFAKSGSSQTILTGTNTYTGGTNLSDGTLTLGNNAALGTGALNVLGSATITSNDDARSVANDITISTSQTVSVAGNNDLTLTGDISGAGAFNIAIDSANTLTLTGTNTYSGGTILTSGTVSADGTTTFGTGNITLAGNATITSSTDNQSIVNNIALAANTLSISDITNLLVDFSGIISGTGSLTLDTVSGISISGNNTFTGGVDVNSAVVTVSENAFGTGVVRIGSTLQIEAATAGINIDNNFTTNTGGSLTAAGTLDFEISGIISGDGGLAKSGTSAVTVSGTNTYTGSTVLGGGTVIAANDQAFSSSLISIAVDTTTLQSDQDDRIIANNFVFSSPQTLILGSDNDLVLSGNITGSGSVTKTGNSVITLSGNNTFDVAFTFNDGTIIAGSDTAFGTPSINVTGSSSIQSGNDTINIANNIALASTLIIDGVNDLQLSGTIGGVAGNLLHFSNGITTLSGTNVLPQELRISNGTVSITGSTTTGAEGTDVLLLGEIAGTGTLVSNLTVFGNISPGATGQGTVGTLSIDGSLDFGNGIYNMDIASTAGPGTGNDLIDVTGTIVDLSGTLLVTALDSYTPSAGDNFTIIQSDNGIPFIFPQVFSNLPAMFTIEQAIVGNDLQITVIGQPIQNTVTARNLVFAAEAFQRILDTSPTGDIDTVLDQLQTLNAPQLINAFEAIVPNYLVTQSQATFRGIDVQNNNITGRIGELRYGIPASFTNNLSLQTPYDWTNPIDPEEQFVIALQNSQSLEQQQEIFRFGGAEKGLWSSWISGYGTFGDFNPALSQAGYEFTTGGVTLGFDYRLLETLAAGAFVGYSNTGTTVDEGQGSNYANTINSGLYMTWFNEEGFYASGLIGGGVNFYENNRRIVFGTIDRVAESSTTGFYFQTLATGGYQFKFKDFAIGPQFALQYVNLQIGSHSESGADSLNLDVGAFNANSFVTRLGFRASLEFDTPENVARPRSRRYLAARISIRDRHDQRRHPRSR